MFWRTITSSFFRNRALTQVATAPLVLVLAWLCLGLSAVGNDELIRDATPKIWQEDAELSDVFFLNAQSGWAVGSQGTILRTTNGGQDWQDLGQATPDQVAPEMGLQQKIRAMQQGQRTQVTGVADGSSDQALPYRCRFESVFFIDEKNGWAAGGYEVPYLNHSRGIILRTADAGVTWRQVRGALLPRIKRIHFSDRTHGWAAGDRGSLMPSCLFYTSDGGETWSNQPILKELTDPVDCLDADATENGFVAIDTAGQPIVFKNGLVEAAVLEGGNGARLNRLRMVDRQAGWCVGDAGAIWRTQNGGVSWSPLVKDSNSPIHQQMQEFDWQALAVSPSKVWFAGNPGSLLFSINRSSGEVLSYSTGVTAPVKGLHFVDDKQGWLVGSLGTILATTDGGQTWHRQRGRQRDVAVLGLAFDEPELPFEALAKYSSEENWLMAVATCKDRLTSAAKQSVERLGGVGLFSIAPGDPAAAPERKQAEQLERLVKLIRTLRPTVILCNSEYQKQAGMGANPNSAFDPYVLLSTAVQAAGNREAFPQQLEIAKLEPWTVERVAYRAPAGELNLEPGRMLLRLGCSIEDRIAISRALLSQPMYARETRSYFIETGSGLRLSGSSNLFDGLSRGANGPIPKRAAEVRLIANRASIEAANRKHERIVELAQFTANTQQDLVVWNQKIQDWLAPIDESLAGVWLAQLAQEYLQRGQIELSAKSLEYLVNRYTGHPLHLPTLTWLVNYYSSDEFGRLELANVSRFRSMIDQTDDHVQQGAQIGRSTTQPHASFKDGQTIMVWAPVSDKIELPKRNGGSSLFNEQVPAVNDPNASPALDHATQSHATQSHATQSHTAQSDQSVELASHNETTNGFRDEEVQVFLESRWRRASSYMVQLNHIDPDLVNQLAFRYLEANLKRKLSGKSSAESLLKRISLADEPTMGLSTAALAELELNANSKDLVLPSNTIRASFTSERPKLDGQLDDQVWQSIQSRELGLKRTVGDKVSRPRGWSDVSPPVKQDVLMFAHDDQFLYVAIRCNKLAGQFYQTSPDARPRDPDLNRRDRVELCFDVDRDYQSGFKFTVDYRGWGAEELNGAVGWNPQWFIARSEDDGTWAVELAIPLEVFSVAIQGGQAGSVEALQSPLNSIPGRVSGIEKEVWCLRAVRVTTNVNLWNDSAREQEKSELSKGLYQQILMEPAKFQFFAFQ